MKTFLGEEGERAILAELKPIIDIWARRKGCDPRRVESSVAFLWEDRARESKEEYDRWLSANEIGPYAGR